MTLNGIVEELHHIPQMIHTVSLRLQMKQFVYNSDSDKWDVQYHYHAEYSGYINYLYFSVTLTTQP